MRSLKCSVLISIIFASYIICAQTNDYSNSSYGKQIHPKKYYAASSKYDNKSKTAYVSKHHNSPYIKSKYVNNNYGKNLYGSSYYGKNLYGNVHYNKSQYGKNNNGVKGAYGAKNYYGKNLYGIQSGYITSCRI